MLRRYLFSSSAVVVVGSDQAQLCWYLRTSFKGAHYRPGGAVRRVQRRTVVRYGREAFSSYGIIHTVFAAAGLVLSASKVYMLTRADMLVRRQGLSKSRAAFRCPCGKPPAPWRSLFAVWCAATAAPCGMRERFGERCRRGRTLS